MQVEDGAPPMEGSESRSRGIQSVEIALDLIGILAAAPGPMSLTELSAAAGMAPSKTHRYLASFIAAGLVSQRQRSGAYDLGKLALQLGLAAMARHDVVNLAARRLEDLVEATGMTALLTVWGNQGPTVVRWERSKTFIVTSLGLGDTLPLLTSASGNQFLSHLPRRVTAPVLARELDSAKRGDTGPQPSEAQIAALIAKVREDGYALTDGRFIPGLYAISAPVLNWQREIEAAITLISTDPRLIDPAGVALQELKAASTELSVTRETPSDPPSLDAADG